MASDLSIHHESIPAFNGDFFATEPDTLVFSGEDPLHLFQLLVENGPADTDLYFSSLAALHRARLKYRNILRHQPTPTVEQIGPRSLLQYGTADTASLTSLLLIRKWIYDIDNRAAQETGYLFEPILAGAIGGNSVSATPSPVRRKGTGKGRQVDCLLGDDAYELKLRVTIAASGQGRWREELEYPVDCRLSGLRPVLIVFDGTPNPKLTELCEAFVANGGEVYIGENAWDHLYAQAGETMGLFLNVYIRRPLDEVIAVPTKEEHDLRIHLTANEARIQVGETQMAYERSHDVNALND